MISFVLLCFFVCIISFSYVLFVLIFFPPTFDKARQGLNFHLVKKTTTTKRNKQFDSKDDDDDDRSD